MKITNYLSIIDNDALYIVEIEHLLTILQSTKVYFDHIVYSTVLHQLVAIGLLFVTLDIKCKKIL